MNSHASGLTIRDDTAPKLSKVDKAALDDMIYKVTYVYDPCEINCPSFPVLSRLRSMGLCVYREYGRTNWLLTKMKK